MPILALETATDTLAVALLREGVVEVELVLRRPRAHAAHLAPFIRDALALAGLAPRDVRAVAVSMGPGSYTGLRIGVSTAKGFAAATGARLVGVPTLAALAAVAAPLARPDEAVVAALGARRREVYAAAWRQGEAVAEAAAVPAEALAAWCAEHGLGDVLLAGDGAGRAAEALAGSERAVRTLPPAVAVPSAAAVARLGALRLAQGEADDVAAFEPFYLKEFIAEKRRGTAFDRLPF